MPIVNSGRNQTGNGPDRCPGQTPATRLRPLPVYSAARQRSAPKPRPESASPSSSQVRTPAFQAGNTGSNPVGDTIAPTGAMSVPSGIRSARLACGSERWVEYPLGTPRCLRARCSRTYPVGTSVPPGLVGVGTHVQLEGPGGPMLSHEMEVGLRHLLGQDEAVGRSLRVPESLEPLRPKHLA